MPVMSASYFWRNDGIGVSEILVYGRIDHESCGLSEHHCRPVVPSHDICLPKWKWSLLGGQFSMSQGSKCGEGVTGT